MRSQVTRIPQLLLAFLLVVCACSVSLRAEDASPAGASATAASTEQTLLVMAKEALREARRAIENSVYSTADVFVRIAAVQATIGDRAEATALLELARRDARRITHDASEEYCLSKIASAQADMGDVPGARQTLGEIVSAGARADVYRAIAFAQVKAGDQQGARETVEEARRLLHSRERGSLGEGEPWVASVLCDIGKAQREVGDVAGARESYERVGRIAERNPHTGGSVGWYLAIAEYEAKGGNKEAASRACERAKQAVRSIERDWFRIDALGEIARTEAAAGDLAGARRTVELARQAASGMYNEWHKEQALADIAGNQAWFGDIPGALQTTRLITDPEESVRALGALTVAYAKAGDAAGMRRTMERAQHVARITSPAPYDHSTAIDLAEALARSGDLAAAGEQFEKARKQVGALTDARRRSEGLTAIASAILRVVKPKAVAPP